MSMMEEVFRSFTETNTQLQQYKNTALKVKVLHSKSTSSVNCTLSMKSKSMHYVAEGAIYMIIYYVINYYCWYITV